MAHYAPSAHSFLQHYRDLLYNFDIIYWDHHTIPLVELDSCCTTTPVVTTVLTLLTRRRVCRYGSRARGCIPIAPGVWPLWGRRGGHRHGEGCGEVLGSLHGCPVQHIIISTPISNHKIHLVQLLISKYFLLTCDNSPCRWFYKILFRDQLHRKKNSHWSNVYCFSQNEVLCFVIGTNIYWSFPLSNEKGEKKNADWRANSNRSNTCNIYKK